MSASNRGVLEFAGQGRLPDSPGFWVVRRSIIVKKNAYMLLLLPMLRGRDDVTPAERIIPIHTKQLRCRFLLFTRGSVRRHTKNFSYPDLWKIMRWTSKWKSIRGRFQRLSAQPKASRYVLMPYHRGLSKWEVTMILGRRSKVPTRSAVRCSSGWAPLSVHYDGWEVLSTLQTCSWKWWWSTEDRTLNVYSFSRFLWWCCSSRHDFETVSLQIGP